MRLTHERHHVMLAMGVEGDIAHQHEVVVFPDLAEGAVEYLGRAFAIAAIELFVGVDHALGRVEQAFALRVIARKGDQRAHCSFGVLARGSRRSGGLSDMVGKLRLAQRLDDSVHNGLSVRPIPKPWTGGVTGAAASVIARRGYWDPCAPTGRRIPILHGFAGAKPAWPTRGLPCSHLPNSPYIFVQAHGAIGGFAINRFRKP